mgnify:CR=1 FL=1
MSTNGKDEPKRTNGHIYELAERIATQEFEAIDSRSTIEDAVRLILRNVGEDPNRDGLLRTPHRVAKMYDELILEDDVYRTIDYCESTGDVVYDASHDLYIGHLRSGVVTYWVEYAKSDQGLVLRNVFFHRMEIVESRSDASVPTSESLIRSDGTP